uniref:Uncharacterized protein n=1 Tax=Chromera velia CCMP2878 TaxID=1169474 RepID=A0A0G4FJF0_9ALVE|eukprot:Cvel_3400.t1-p1 / transcript=Cvel_3400.t1 / gene=Cvel_3400 / organism=Chromera_velia_CCMP2878 / gene_product=hypothetical protein / transcript_product=hypothetical protein / location=Cvel_scaffold137:9343-9921(-) / protein_length=139 / sequence_SO=supercontig / SO=protein_coding / is_pseudo=false
MERSLSPSQRRGPTLESDPPISGPPPSGGVAPPPAFDSPSTSPERSDEEEVSRGNVYGARDAPQVFEQMFRGLLTDNAEAVRAVVEMGNRWSPGGPETSGGAQPKAKALSKAKASPSPPQMVESVLCPVPDFSRWGIQN